MADKKISALTALAQGDVVVSTDVLPIVDTSATETKKIAVNALVGAAAAAGLTNVDINSGTIDGTTIATSDITIGSGKTLNVSAGTLTLADNQINGDKVEGGTINAITINTLTSTAVNATTVDATNVEVTNIKAKDGTAAATIADSTGSITFEQSPVIFETSNTERGRIVTSGGNFDFLAGSTTTPTISLASNVATFTNNPILSGGTANGVLYLNGSKVATSGSALTFTNPSTFVTRFNINSLVGTATYKGGIEVEEGSTSFRLYGPSDYKILETDGFSTPSNIKFYANNTEGMRLTSTGLGIGTSSPTFKLDVSGTSNVLQTTSSTTTNNFYQVTSSGTTVLQNDQGAYAFYTGGSERMRLTSSGNVGIGTSSPAGRLHITTASGNTDFIHDVTGTGTAARTVYQRGGAIQFYAGLGAWSGTDTYQIAGASGPLTTLDSSGNLGIGTISPAVKLDVAGASTTQVRVQMSGQADVRLLSDTGTGITGTYSNHPFTIKTNSADVMSLTAAGNVGIGTSSPTAKLQIYEPTAAAAQIRVLANGGQQAALQLAGNGNTFGTTSFDLFQDGGNDAYVANRANASLQFWTNNTERARITSGGAFLVGTTASNTAGTGSIISAFIGATNNTSGAACFQAWNQATTGDNLFVDFYTEGGSGTQRGTIDYNRAGGQVRYNTTSDYRAKEVYGPVDDSGEQIDALKVYRGKMLGATQERPMMIAHEAQEVVPYAVGGEKDAVNEDGTPKYQTMDHQILVPLLIAELQSLRKRVAELEAK